MSVKSITYSALKGLSHGGSQVTEPTALLKRGLTSGRGRAGSTQPAPGTHPSLGRSLNPPCSYLQSKIQVQFLSTQAVRSFLLCRQTSTYCPAQEEEKMGDWRGNGGNTPVSMVCNYGQVLSVT